jgi:hypothetical protein
MKFDRHFLDDICARVPISTVVGSRVSWDRRKTNARKGDFWACCPFHGEKSPSFHCEDKKGRYFCFGCGASGNHFKFLTELDGMTFTRAVETVAGLAGIPMPGKQPPTEQEKAEAARRAKERAAAEEKRKQEAEAHRQHRILSSREIWQETLPFKGSLGEVYAEWRCPGLARWADDNIRFHPALEMDPENPCGDTWPAIVARVSDVDGKGCAIWRIYLARDGMGKKPVKPGFNAKMGYGPAAGGAVRLGGIAETIGLCEGVETSFAIRELGVSYPVWPALSTSGIIGFQIPQGVKCVICYPDPDGTKLKTKVKPNGESFIAQPPGPEAVRKFKERNPTVDIRSADAAFKDDFLEILQKLRKVPVR